MNRWNVAELSEKLESIFQQRDKMSSTSSSDCSAMKTTFSPRWEIINSFITSKNTIHIILLLKFINTFYLPSWISIYINITEIFYREILKKVLFSTLLFRFRWNLLFWSVDCSGGAVGLPQWRIALIFQLVSDKNFQP